MNETIDAFSGVMPGATPGETDIGAWQALARDEQLRLLQAKLLHPDCSTVSQATMKNVLGRAQATAKHRDG